MILSKKRILLIILGIVLTGSSLRAEKQIRADLVEEVKATVAYEMNLLSLRPSEGDNEKSKRILNDFKKCAKGKATIDEVKGCLPEGYSKSVQLCDAIARLESHFSNKDDLISYFSEDIFNQQEGEIKTFTDKRTKDDIQRLQKSIREEITELIRDADNLYQEDAAKSGVEEDIADIDGGPARGGFTPTSRTINRQRDSAMPLELLSKYGGWMLFLATLVVSIILLLRTKKLKKEVARKAEKEAQERRNLREKIEALQAYEKNLRTKISDLEKDLDAARKIIGSIKAKKEKDSDEVAPSKAESKPQSPKTIYLGKLENDVFTKVSEQHDPDDLFCKMSTIDDHTGEYEYINDAENIVYARNSLSEFVRPACKVENEDISDFSAVVTTMKGKVVKVDNGWKITQKATVRLQ